MLIEEALVKIGVKTDVGELTKLENTLKNLPKLAMMAGALVVGSLAGLTAFVSANLEALDAVRQLAKETNNSAEEIYYMGKVAEVNGSSVEAVNNSYRSLAQTIGEAASGTGQGAKAFDILGLKARQADGSVKSTSAILQEVRERIKGLSEQRQIAFLSKLGIDGSMVQILRLTNEELQEATNRAKIFSLGVGTGENAEQAAAFQDSVTELKQIMRGVSEFFALKLAPSLSLIIEKFRDWFLVNHEVVKNGLERMVSLLSLVIGFVGDLCDVLSRIIQSTIGWDNALLAIATTLAIVKRAMITAFLSNPVTLLMMAIVGVVYLIKDFFNYLDGGESRFGAVWEKVIQYVNELMPLFNFFKEQVTLIVDAFMLLGNAIMAVFDGDFSKAEELFGQFIEKIKKLFLNILSFFWDRIKAYFSRKLNEVAGLFDNLAKYIVGPFKDAFNWISQKYEKYIKPIIDKLSSLSWDNVEQQYEKTLATQGKAMADFYNEVYATGIGISSPQESARVGAVANHSSIDNSKKMTVTVNNHIKATGELSHDIKKSVDVSSRAIEHSLSSFAY